MKYVLIVLALAALCVPAFAQDGENPGIKIFIHVTDDTSPVPTDNATVVNEFSPAALTTVRAYVGLTDFSTGMTVISFRLNDAVASCPGVMATQGFTSLLPGGLTIGNVFGDPGNPGGETDGVTLASTECMPGPYDILLVGYAEYFYLGGACAIEILDHGNTDWARWVVDCQDPGVFNAYCVWMNGAVGGAAVPAGDPDCEADTPVEDVTWTSIKALYR